MSDRLTLARFRELADAYGGVVARWPEAERAAAMRMASEPSAAAILRAASSLDDTLDAWRAEAPSPLLRERVLHAAPVLQRSLRVRARLWWSGLGLAAALAGAAAGTSAAALVAPPDVSDSSTSFGDVGGQET